MTLSKEEVEKEHQELNLQISKILWDFADKHCTDNREEGHQAFFIMQAVLSESQSNLEYQIGRMAPFTDRQIDHICFQIGEWYLIWRDCITDPPRQPHKLGYAKEKLKSMICGD